MKILVLGLNYAPELIGIGKYTGEMVDYLSAHDCEVRVVTTPPYYPQWKIAPGHTGWDYRRETAGATTIWRCPLWMPRRVTGLTRILLLFSFAVSCIPAMFAQIPWKPDLVLCIIPALFSAPVAWLTARLCGAKSWLHIQDFELDAAFQLNILPGKQTLRPLIQFFETLILTRFDQISSISENMLALSIQKGVKKERTTLFANWVDTNAIRPISGLNPLRAELDIDPNLKIVLYHGNMGYKQGLETVIEAARLIENSNPGILFLICGEGGTRLSIQSRAEGLSNLRFIPLQPVDKLNLLVNLADIHVMPQRKDAADLVMPSKLTTMLASGKPVIACAAPGTQIYKVVIQVGIVVPPEEPSIMADKIIKLTLDSEMGIRLGRAGREYACENLSSETVLSQFQTQLG